MTKPLNYLSDLLCIDSVTWDVQRNDELSGSGDGRVWQAELAPPLWTADITVNINYHDQIKQLAARLRALHGSKEPFFINDPLSLYPSNDPTGILKDGLSSIFADTIKEVYLVDGASVTSNTIMSLSRTGSSSFYRNDGTMSTAANNSLRFDHIPSHTNYVFPSENLNSSRWVKARMGSSYSHTVDGHDFYKITPDTTPSSTHIIAQNNVITYTQSPSDLYVNVSFIAKSDGEQSRRIAVRCFDSIGFIQYIYFDILNGSVTSGLGGDIQSLGNGYFKCSVSYNVRKESISAGMQLYAAHPSSNSVNTFDFNGIDGYLISACQMCWGLSTPPYNKTVDAPKATPLGVMVEQGATNLLANSSNQMLSSYGAASANKSVSTIQGLDGQGFFTKVSEGSSVATHRLSINLSGQSEDTVLWYSAFVKAGERKRVLISNYNFAGWKDRTAMVLDTESGQTFISGVNGQGFAQYIGNGVWRAFIRGVANGSGSIVSFAVGPRPDDSEDNGATQGDGVSGIYTWGWQVEVGDTPTSYIATTSTSATRSNEVVTIKTINAGDWVGNVDGVNYSFNGNSVIVTPSEAVDGFIKKIDLSGSGIFKTITISNINAQRNLVSFSGFPAGYKLTFGDKFQVDYGTTTVRHAFIEIAGNYTANASGNISNVSIFPELPVGINTNDIANFVKPACQMIIVPQSFNPGRASGRFTNGLTFKAIQKK